MILRLLRRLSLLPILLLALTGCTQRFFALSEQEGDVVNVRFFWDNAINADPEGMTLLFYSSDKGGGIWRFDIAGRDGGQIELPFGHYRMLAVNNDIAGIILSGQDQESSVMLSTTERADHVAIMCPGMSYGCRMKDVTVSPCGVGYTGEDNDVKECGASVIKCYPDTLSTIYHLIINDVEGMEYLRSAKAYVEGPAKGMNLSSLTPVAPSLSMPCTMTTDLIGGTLDGTTCGFPLPDDTTEYGVTLNVTSKSGKSYSKKFTASDLTVNIFSIHCVYITISGLSIPSEPGPTPPDKDDDVGIDVDVDGWNVIEIDLST